MSGLELLPVSGGAAVPVPPGETVLGRGPLLGISDKRVSRNHAMLQNKDGRLRLKSTHVNPVFLQSGSDAAPRPLTRDQWAELQPGDTLSLLPGQFCYRLTGGAEPDQGLDQGLDQELKGDVEQGTDRDEPERHQEPAGTPRNSQMFEEEPRPETSAPIGPQQTQSPPSRKTLQSQAEEETLRKSPDQAQTPIRPRVLPTWMMSAAPASSSSYSPGAAKREKATSSGRKQTTPSRRAPPPVTSSTPKAPPPVTSSTPKAPPPVTSSTPKAPVTSSTPKAPPPVTSSTPKAPAPVSEGSEEEEEEQRLKKRRRKMNGSERASAVPSAVSPDSSPDPDPTAPSAAAPSAAAPSAAAPSATAPSAAAPSLTSRRDPCPYGRGCYRKNPLHFQEQSHPGDSDYEGPSPDEDSDAQKNPLHFQEQSHPGDSDYEGPSPDEDSDEASDRPECPYGTDCYRKNPLHRKEFKHSKRPARKTRGPAPKRRADEDDEDDEYESSFIDSESDYEPPAQRSSSESEDLSQLQREASRFTRK